MENSRPIYLEIFHILCDVLATLTCYAMLFKNRMQHEILIEKEVLEGSSPPTFLTLFSYFTFQSFKAKMNSYQRCDIAWNFGIIHSEVQRLSQYNLKISHRRHI
jgi:hypothetical protein